MFHDGRVEPDPLGTFKSGFWSPAREHLPEGLDNLLAAQAMFPILSAFEMAGQKGENPVATAVAEDRVGDAWDLLAARLAETLGYRALFEAAFPGETDVTMVQAANALAAFQSVAFRSDTSPFDAFIEGDPGALSWPALNGMVRHHLDSVASLNEYNPETAELLPLGGVIEQTGKGSKLIFHPLNPARRGAFSRRDTWVQNSDELRSRIAASNELPSMELSDREVDEIMSFLGALTDPSAVDRSDMIPTNCPRV